MSNLTQENNSELKKGCTQCPKKMINLFIVFGIFSFVLFVIFERTTFSFLDEFYEGLFLGLEYVWSNFVEFLWHHWAYPFIGMGILSIIGLTKSYCNSNTKESGGENTGLEFIILSCLYLIPFVLVVAYPEIYHAEYLGELHQPFLISVILVGFLEIFPFIAVFLGLSDFWDNFVKPLRGKKMKRMSKYD